MSPLFVSRLSIRDVRDERRSACSVPSESDHALYLALVAFSAANRRPPPIKSGGRLSPENALDLWLDSTAWGGCQIAEPRERSRLDQTAPGLYVLRLHLRVACDKPHGAREDDDQDSSTTQARCAEPPHFPAPCRRCRGICRRRALRGECADARNPHRQYPRGRISGHRRDDGAQ